MLHAQERMQNWILPFTTNSNNVFKFFLINTVIIPLLKMGLYSVVCRLATLHVLNGGKVRVRETRSALYGLSSHYFGGQKWRILTIFISCGFLAVSLISEYGFGTAQVDKVKRVQVLEPVPFRSLNPKHIMCRKRRPSNWFLKQSSFCMDRLEANTFEDSAMGPFRGRSRTELQDYCINWALTMPNPARQRFIEACAHAGQSTGTTMSYMVLNWTNTVKFREGGVSYPENQVVCVGHTRKNVESRGHIFGVGWDHNSLDRIFMLPARQKYLPSFTFNLTVLKGYLGGIDSANKSVLLDGKGTSCATWNGNGNLLCLTISTGESVFPPDTSEHNHLYRIVFSKGVPVLPPGQMRGTNASVVIDVHAIWTYLELPYGPNKNDSVELRNRRLLSIYDLAMWPRLWHLSSKQSQSVKKGASDTCYVEDTEMLAVSGALIAAMTRKGINLVPAKHVAANIFLSEMELATMNEFALIYFMSCALCIFGLFVSSLILNALINRNLAPRLTEGKGDKQVSGRSVFSPLKAKWLVDFSAEWLIWKAHEDRVRNGTCTQYEDTRAAIGLTDEGASYHLGIVASDEWTVGYARDKPIA